MVHMRATAKTLHGKALSSMRTSRPRLVTVAHGTRKSGGNEVAREITVAAGLALGTEAVCSYVELTEPLFEDVVAADVTPTVVLPLLLSTGFHLRQDLPRMAAGAGGSARPRPAAGPPPADSPGPARPARTRRCPPG